MSQYHCKLCGKPARNQICNKCMKNAEPCESCGEYYDKSEIKQGLDGFWYCINCQEDGEEYAKR